jgi:alcohol dehydrogenase class IV
MQANLRGLRSREPNKPALSRYDEVARLLTANENATADEGVEWVRKLVADLQIPALSKYGISAEHISELVQKASNASSMKANPIVLSPSELTDILKCAL